jgi:hypothetical protein
MAFGNNAFPTSKKPMASKSPVKPAAAPMASSSSGSGSLASKIAECEAKIADLEQRVSALEQGEQGETDSDSMADQTPGGDYSSY